MAVISGGDEPVRFVDDPPAGPTLGYRRWTVTQATGNLTTILSRVDLNQLVALDALLREKSVTKAASALGLTQPALSASLGRLRRYFNDELLRRVGNSYELTPLASLLAERTTTALNAAGAVFSSQTQFDPEESDREFTLYLSDYATSVLAPTLARLTRVEAPQVRVRIQQLTVAAVENAETVLRDHDGIVIPHGFIENLPHLDLFRDTYVCLVSADNTDIGAELTIEDLTRTPMVTAYMASSGGNTALIHLRMAGVEPNLETVTESFLTVPFLIAGTDRIGMVPSLLARRIAKLGEVRPVVCPYPTGELVEALWWHRSQHNDQGHRWFRNALRRAAATVETS